eukprot:scaffold9323_cov73-Skeletonema_marinoi.AAC.1
MDGGRRVVVVVLTAEYPSNSSLMAHGQEMADDDKASVYLGRIGVWTVDVDLFDVAAVHDVAARFFLAETTFPPHSR